MGREARRAGPGRKEDGDGTHQAGREIFPNYIDVLIYSVGKYLFASMLTTPSSHKWGPEVASKLARFIFT
jgi:hypothetical protein